MDRNDMMSRKREKLARLKQPASLAVPPAAATPASPAETIAPNASTAPVATTGAGAESGHHAVGETGKNGLQEAPQDTLQKALAAAQKEAIKRGVTVSPLPGQSAFPLVVRPIGEIGDPIAWAAANRDFIEGLLCRHASLLFRDFALTSHQGFESFAEALSPGLYGDYGDLPKKEEGRNTYRSTPYPEKEMILYHNESAHTGQWPRKQLFFCELPSLTGGATPIVDVRQMLVRLPAAIVETFERKGLIYVRTFNPRLDVSWQSFYGTSDRDVVSARCDAAGVVYRWLGDDVLQTRTICPAVIRHPVTGERAFFNQVQLHHPSCLDPDVREDLLELVGEDRLPRNVLYGDGTPIPDAVMAEIGRAYEACAVRFGWQKGDVAILDNMLTAHARDPYSGPRKIVVAMGNMMRRNELDTPPVTPAVSRSLAVDDELSFQEPT